MDKTSNFPIEKDAISLTLKFQIDNALVNYINGNDYFNPVQYFENEWQSYPLVPNRFYSGYNVLSQMGAFYYFLVPLYLFIHIQGEIVGEKEGKILQGLQVFGINQKSFYVSWFLTSTIMATYLSFLKVIFSMVFNFEYFLQTPFLISFWMFFSFTMNMQALGLFLQTFTTTKKENYQLSFVFVLLSIVIELFISQQSFVLAYLYALKRSIWVEIAIWIMHLYSPFNYNLAFMLISLKAGHHFDDISGRWEPGEGFYWQDFFQGMTGEINGKKFASPSIFKIFFLYQVINFFFYIGLAILFDEENMGFWKKKNKKNTKQELFFEEFNLQNQQNSVQQEYQRVQENSQKDIPSKGIRIENLSKVYQSNQNWFYSLIQSKNSARTHNALKNLTLEINKGELISILGHNGAGKTTLINILCGIQKPTQGKVTICENDLTTQLQEIRQILGVCPQFDVLWEQLTAMEHLEIFGKIRGLQNIEKTSKEILKKVKLDHLANAQAKTLSGGMKRRLSIAICSQGNPKVIFLDEPTTGMDTKIRREVWQLIQEIKEDKSIILTTHSMEEAQVLSDRIAIMVQGELKCVGSSLNLKNEYGGGYNLLILLKDQQEKCQNKNINSCVECLQETFLEMFQEIQIGHKTNSEICLKIHNLQTLKEILQILEEKNLNQYHFFQNFKEYSLQHSTIEDVFRNITQQYYKN